MSVRHASHAGSWYTSNANKLKAELANNLIKVDGLEALGIKREDARCKALIGPHAGFSYSGPAAAHAYSTIPVSQIETVFLLGPSHHYFLDQIALSTCSSYETPLGSIPLDTDIIKELHRTGLFEQMEKPDDEEEHSLEMHLPYLRHVFGSKEIKLVPLLVGTVSQEKMDDYAKVFKQWWDDPKTFWVISSDFCHWGTRFHHTPYYPNPPPVKTPVPPVSTSFIASDPQEDYELLQLSRTTKSSDLTVPIWESIQAMDHEAIDILRHGGQEGCGKEFKKYLSRTRNTICGRNPISQLLAILELDQQQTQSKVEVVFVRYEQSSQVETLKDSSVSYVSGVVLRQA